jgi:hypothetical protein
MDQIEWDYRSTLIELRPGDGTAEPFFIHLFKGCVLFESLLKANPKDIPPPTRHTLDRVLQYLHSHLSTPANIDIGGKTSRRYLAISRLPTIQSQQP